MNRPHKWLAVAFIAFLAQLAPVSAPAQTDVAGTQSGTWTTAESPYRLVGDVVVPADQTLAIQAGVEIAAADTFRFTVHGTLSAVGTADHPILFHAETPSRHWRGLRLVDANDDCELIHCTIQDGQVVGHDWPEDTGGGLRLWNTAASVSHCTFMNNTSSYFGGGVFCYGDSAAFDDCLFTDNHSDFDGGGLYIYTSDAAVSNSRFLGNTCSSYGAALALSTSFSKISRSVFAGNTAGAQAGAVQTEWSGPVFSNCTITDNSAPYGGGFYVVSSTIEMINCIDHGNSGYQPDIYLDWFGEVHANACDIHGDVSGPGVIDLDPLFVAAAAGDYRLTDQSPCLDTGLALYVSGGDTLVFIPPQEYDGAAPDMGAYERWHSTAIHGETTSQPPRLLANYPNPFNPATTIVYTLPIDGAVRLEVLDLRGRRVRLLVDREFSAGRHRINWRGDDDAGRSAPSGLYITRLTAAGIVQTRALDLVR